MGLFDKVKKELGRAKDKVKKNAKPIQEAAESVKKKAEKAAHPIAQPVSDALDPLKQVRKKVGKKATKVAASTGATAVVETVKDLPATSMDLLEKNAAGLARWSGASAAVVGGVLAPFTFGISAGVGAVAAQAGNAISGKQKLDNAKQRIRRIQRDAIFAAEPPTEIEINEPAATPAASEDAGAVPGPVKAIGIAAAVLLIVGAAAS